ncbi:inositol monophosphatase family protein [Tuwongella immobilis]|uniref:Histidinol-phosphatase n=1 Tax=Tuwongella immobilis TaxID=692036 RepID=A0A6C2YKV0_9BACT|nr:inositol monophosphatase family protein [Tuwongella immobilis]VIP01931.1 inositol monophosphatase family protein : Uncharacterized protein OS=Candidatus Entotheonella sp. TSY1 GN=ETSY1_43535 PE=4 SV=1: Inositol_P [Tuwongella immobilis]VTR99881.1 inositol monophosphatase family protein : Uncharacterized protein OS=Candidatus Entotheonella sp. TSY1 GN=ETSY1_43535 PE=4 SV=1: Inositol_P [Tuwongella immobilis]
MNPEWRSRYELAIEAAHQAGKLAMSYFEHPLEVERKSDDSPVTIADRSAEERIRGLVSKFFPQDGFLGEEYGDQPSSSGFRWIIDPIDGTKSFVRGIPIWATLIGLEYRNEQIGGVVYIPTFDQTFHALKGNGAYRDSKRIRVSSVTDLSQSVLAYSSMGWFQRAGKADCFLKLYGDTGRQRGFGDFYGFVLVAQGAVDLMVEHGVNPWDVAATKVLVEEAGGRFTDWDNEPTIHRPDVLASNGQLHARVLTYLQAAKQPPEA